MYYKLCISFQLIIIAKRNMSLKPSIKKVCCISLVIFSLWITYKINRHKTFERPVTTIKELLPRTKLYVVSSVHIQNVDDSLSNVSDKTIIPFLDNYKNPCWYSKFVINQSAMYESNQFYLPENKLHKLTELRERLFKDYKQNIPQFQCIPHVYILGTHKCGTTCTDLHSKLVSHHQIFNGMRKEYFWWNERRFGGKSGTGIKVPMSQYIELFDVAADKIKNECPNVETGYNPCITIDGSPSTLWFSPKYLADSNDTAEVNLDPQNMVPGILHKLNPNAKFIAILRDPTTRAYSDYNYFKPKGYVQNPALFHKDVVFSIDLYNNCIRRYGSRLCSYNTTLIKQLTVGLNKGMYYIFLKDWLQVWPEKQIWVFRFEDYTKRRMEKVNIQIMIH